MRHKAHVAKSLSLSLSLSLVWFPRDEREKSINRLATTIIINVRARETVAVAELASPTDARVRVARRCPGRRIPHPRANRSPLCTLYSWTYLTGWIITQWIIARYALITIVYVLGSMPVHQYIAPLPDTNCPYTPQLYIVHNYPEYPALHKFYSQAFANGEGFTVQSRASHQFNVAQSLRYPCISWGFLLCQKMSL